MKRSVLVALIATTAISPRVARAQLKAMPAIGLFSSASLGLSAPGQAAFFQGLSKGGYVGSQNVAIE